MTRFAFSTTLPRVVADSGGINPALFGMPTAATTGVQDGITLTTYSGSTTIASDNVTIENKTITGTIGVQGNNCTIRNCRFINGGYFAIDADPTAANLLIEYCDIIGDSTTAITAISATGTIRYCDISGYENGIVVLSGASVVVGNFIHGLNNDDVDPHVDGVAIQGNQTSVLVEGNTIQSWDTSCVFIKNDFGPISNVTVRYNLLMPDPTAPGPLGYNLPVDGRAAGGAITNTLFEHNYLASGIFGDISIDSATVVLRNNTSWVPNVDPIPYPNLSDNTPNAFSFTDATNVALSTVSTSNSITVSGLGVMVPISITGGQYEKNGTGVWTSTAGTVFNTDTVKVRGTSSGSNSTAINVVLTIGTMSDTYTITTVAGAGDTIPNAFSFTDATNVALSTVSTSNSITVSGIDTLSAISVTGGEYEKNASGTWTGSSGTVVNGDTVKVRGTSSASNSTAVNVVLNIGGVTDTYTITTVAAVGFSFTPLAYYDESSFQDSGSGTASAWLDKGLNGINLTQATSGARPTITSGKLVFDGTDDVLVSAAQDLSAKTALCAFISLKINAFGPPGDGDGILVLGPTGGSDNDPTAALMFYPYDVDGMGSFRGAAFKVGAPQGLTQLHGVTFDLPADTVTLYNHSADLSSAVTTLSNGSFGSALHFVLGSRWISGAVASAYHAPIDVNRLLILDFIPNSTQRDEIWAWLAVSAPAVPNAPVLTLLSSDPDDHMEIGFTLTGAIDTDQVLVEFDDDPTFATIDEDDTVSLTPEEVAAEEGTLSITSSISGLIYARAYLKRGAVLSEASNVVSMTITAAFSFTPLAYYDETSVVQTAGAVSQWTDKGLNGIHLKQATGAAQPAWNGTEIAFDGIDDYLVWDDKDLSDRPALAAFARVNLGPATSGGHIAVLGPPAPAEDHTGPGCIFWYFSDPATLRTYRSGGSFIGVSLGVNTSIGGVHDKVAGVVAACTPSIYSPVSTGEVAAFSNAGRVFLGARWASGARPGGFGNFRIRRFLLIDFVPTVGQRDEIWAWLQPPSAFSFTPLAYYDETSVVQTAGAVSQWGDKGPNGIHLKQATGAAQPAWNAGTGWTTFDGVNDCLVADATDLLTKTALCAFARVIVAPGTGGGLFCFGEDGGGDASGYGGIFWYSSASNTLSLYRGSGLALAVTEGTDVLIGAVHDSVGDEYIYNRTAGTSNSGAMTNATFSSATRFTLGSRWLSAPASFCNMSIRRLVLLDFVPSAAQRDEIWAWLAG